MRVMVCFLLILAGISPAARMAQAEIPAANANANPVAALAFLSGRWTSDAAEDREEEYWSPVMGESIVGHFRVVAKGKSGTEKAVFYEFWAIELEDGKAIFKMKHFNHGLAGWEEKGDVVRLETRMESPQAVLFTRPDGSLSLRYERKGDELVSTLRQMKNGTPHEEVFHLHRSE